MNNYQAAKGLVLAYFDELDAATPEQVEDVIERYMSNECDWRGVHPFKLQNHPRAVAQVFWEPLMRSFSGLKRHQDVFMAGTNELDGEQWVMSMGHFVGLFDEDWLGIPAHHKLTMLRYAEFNCVVDGRITRTGMFCDIIGLMHQVGIQPLPPQTGASFVVPGPRKHDGLLLNDRPTEEGEKTLALVNRMIEDLSALNASGNDHCSVEYLSRSWHEDMLWYGPAGIGATYTIPRYQVQHQYPFREGLADKDFKGHVCRFAEGNYACFFGWPNLSHRPTGGLMGLTASQPTEMRVVDVYRRDGDKLRENWVIIDIPHWLMHQGLDVLERTRNIYNPE